MEHTYLSNIAMHTKLVLSLVSVCWHRGLQLHPLLTWFLKRTSSKMFEAHGWAFSQLMITFGWGTGNLYNLLHSYTWVLSLQKPPVLCVWARCWPMKCWAWVTSPRSDSSLCHHCGAQRSWGEESLSLLGPFPTWPPTMGFLFAGRCDLGAWVLLIWPFWLWWTFNSSEPWPEILMFKSRVLQCWDPHTNHFCSDPRERGWRFKWLPD